ncbi:MAG: thiamine pyrophosphate-dependent dehydrogenase E1 component subunit alpha [Pseudomonadota bacterium]
MAQARRKWPDVEKQTLVELFRKMLLIRCFEEKIVEVYGAQDMKTPVHLCIGQEAIAAGVCQNLSREDYIFTTHRSHGHCLAKGMSPVSLYAEFYGRKGGCCKGKGGSMHPADAKLGILGTTAIVGGGIPLATGAALASVMRKEKKVSVAFFGDGAAEQGTFHESLNFAVLKKLPVVYVCENNYYATASPQAARQGQANIASRAQGYGLPGIQVDGNDVLDVYHNVGEAIAQARNGEGPSLIEALTYRWKGHVGPEEDWTKGLRPREELERWKQECPVKRFTKHVIETKILSERDVKDVIGSIREDIDSALEAARAIPFPKSENLLEDVFAEKS